MDGNRSFPELAHDRGRRVAHGNVGAAFISSGAHVLLSPNAGDLLETLEGLSVEPLGSETVDNTVWVHYKEVDPYQIEDPLAEML